jgi:hypothetical protein
MTDRIMIDIETLGTDPGAAIVSIGAVAFGRDGRTETPFHRSISLQSCQRHGLHIDAETLAWWLDEDPRLAAKTLPGGDPLPDVLSDLAVVLAPADEVWANSPAFDCVILEAAYDAVGQDLPWEYWQTRDARTVTELAAVDLPQDGTEHDALDDTRHQVEEVGEALERLEVLEPPGKHETEAPTNCE